MLCFVFVIIGANSHLIRVKLCNLGGFIYFVSLNVQNCVNDKNIMYHDTMIFREPIPICPKPKSKLKKKYFLTKQLLIFTVHFFLFSGKTLEFLFKYFLRKYAFKMKLNFIIKLKGKWTVFKEKNQ